MSGDQLEAPPAVVHVDMTLSPLAVAELRLEQRREILELTRRLGLDSKLVLMQYWQALLDYGQELNAAGVPDNVGVHGAGVYEAVVGVVCEAEAEAVVGVGAELEPFDAAFQFDVTD
jgi:hypothetical protein